LHELSYSQEKGTLVAEEHVISVIILAFKESATIRRVIKEVEESTSYPTQIIVVDGCSNDGTEEIVKKGLRITEIPTTYKPRNNHSKSKLNPFSAGCDVLRILLFG
jgi:glycosyltransferase involved in cell wall biosynthesis